MRIYLDVCCLNRPFDDLSKERVQFESDAILAIISRCQVGKWNLVTSETISYEVSEMRNNDKLEKVNALVSVAAEKLLLSDTAIALSAKYQKSGINAMDSYHLAIAEESKVDVFLTTDDKLLNATKKLNLTIEVENPITWFMEVIKNEK